MNTHTTHTYTAADELDRRVANRALAAAGLPKDPPPATTEGRRLAGMSTSELLAEAGRTTPTPVERKTARTQARSKAQARKAQAPKPAPARKMPERTPAQKAATQARSKAWAALMAEKAAAKAADRKPAFNYAQACEMFGVTPAKG